MTFPVFPLAVTVGWHQYTPPATKDAYGDIPSDAIATAYTPPLNVAGTPVSVYGVAPRTTSHVPVSGHDRIVTDKTMYAPEGCPIGTYDYVDLPEGQYLVEGIGEDWSFGPFNWAPGVEYHLRRITG